MSIHIASLPLIKKQNICFPILSFYDETQKVYAVTLCHTLNPHLEYTGHRNISRNVVKAMEKEICLDICRDE